MKPNDELLQKIGQVRTKWKTLLWARGLAWVLGVLVASIAVGLYLASTPKVPFWLLNVLKLAGVAALVTAVVRTLVMPLRRVPTDEQLARFVQEKNPGLEDRLVSAVEAIHRPRPDQGMFSYLVVKDALDRTRNVQFTEQINKRHITTFALSTGALVLLLLGGLYLSTLYLPYGVARLTANVLKAPAVDALTIKLKPGNVTVPKGEDVTIDAILSGFDPERADINLRFENSSNWEVSSMQVVPDKEPTYRHRIFNIQDQVHYFVTAGGRKSDEYTIKVADLPKLEKLDYTFHYPAYTKMADKHEENGFDMVALKGTTVAVIANSNKPLSGGQLVFKDGKNIPLKASSTNPKQVTALVTIDRTTTFQVELTDTSRQTYKGLEVFNMEALEDQKPVIKFSKPGRDVPATNLEEVFTEVRAEDDFGVNTLDIYYSVNGKAEKKIEVFANKGDAPREMSGGHTFFMEEFGVKPGDFVSYYAKATDNMNPANTATSDLYFIEVRPFSREFTQSQAGGQRGGGGGGGGQRGQQDDSAQALVKRQRDINVATFNVGRDKDKFAPKEYTDNLHAIAEGQSKLAVDVANVVRRLEARQLTDDKQVKEITDYFKKATEQMGPAADQLNKEKLDAAKEYESTALQYLSNAAALYTQIQVQQGGGGGGGGGGGARSAQDLADLFALELDTSKNQYEQVQRGQAAGGQQEQQAQQEVDELAKKLADLAKRQEAAARQRAAQAGQGGGGAADAAAQRDLLREAQALQRQLQKLTRDTQDPKVAEASRQVDQAVQNMQQAMNSGTPQQQQQAANQAATAIQNANRALGQTQNQNGNSPTGNLAQQAQQLKNLQNEQQKLLDETRKQFQTPESPQRQQALQSLSQRERSLEDKTRAAQQDLQNAGRNTQNPQAASASRAAANSLQTNRVADRMQAAANGIEANNPRSDERQQQAAEFLGDAAKQLGQAAAAVDNAPQRQLQAALNSTADAQRQLNSLQRRLQEQQNQQGQQGQQGQGQQGQGQQGQQGQGQQGQQGQGQQGQGQQGQQGQGQQGQGQQGQQGQGQQGQQGQGQQGQQGQGQQGQQGQGQQGQQGQGQQGQQGRGQQGQGQQGQGQQGQGQQGQGQQGQGQQGQGQQGQGQQGQGQQGQGQQGQGQQGQGQQGRQGQGGQGQQGQQGQGQQGQQTQLGGGPGGNRQVGNNGGQYNGGYQNPGSDVQNPRQLAGELGNIGQNLQNALDQLGRNNPAAPSLNQAISAVNSAQSQALKGVILDPAEITKLKDVLGNAEVAVSRQLEVLVAKENARSPQEDSFPEGYVKQNAEYFKSLANQSPKQ